MKKREDKIKIICKESNIDSSLEDYSLLFYLELIATLKGKRKYLYIDNLKVPPVPPTVKEHIELSNELTFEELPDFFYEELKIKKILILEGPNKVGKSTIIKNLKERKVFNPEVLFRADPLRKNEEFYPLSHFIGEQIFDYSKGSNELVVLDRIGYLSSMVYRPEHQKQEYFRKLEKFREHIYVLLPYNYVEEYPENKEIYLEYKVVAERLNLKVIDTYKILNFRRLS